MKKSKVRRVSKALAALLAFLILGFAVSPAGWANVSCEKALAKCMIDAFIAMILSGPEAGGLYALGCLNGYAWCLKYYIDFEKEEAC